MAKISGGSAAYYLLFMTAMTGDRRTSHKKTSFHSTWFRLKLLSNDLPMNIADYIMCEEFWSAFMPHIKQKNLNLAIKENLAGLKDVLETLNTCFLYLVLCSSDNFIGARI